MKYCNSIQEAIQQRGVLPTNDFSRLGRGKWYHWRVEVLLCNEKGQWKFAQWNPFQRLFCKLHLFGYHKKTSLKTIVEKCNQLHLPSDSPIQALGTRINTLAHKTQQEIQEEIPVANKETSTLSDLPVCDSSFFPRPINGKLPKLSDKEDKQLQEWIDNNDYPDQNLAIWAQQDTWLHASNSLKVLNFIRMNYLNQDGWMLYQYSYENQKPACAIISRGKAISKEPPKKDPTKIGLLVNHGEMHHAFAYCDIDKQEIHYFDSLPFSDEKMKKTLQACVTQLSKDIPETLAHDLSIFGIPPPERDYSPLKDCRIILHKECPTQRKAQCGVYALACGYFAFYGEPVRKDSFDDQSILAFRRYALYQQIKFYKEQLPRKTQ